jgi:maleate isomerase
VDAVFISCTNLRALNLIAELESKLAKPVISSNQALGWHCLRLAGVKSKLSQYGRLLA